MMPLFRVGDGLTPFVGEQADAYDKYIDVAKRILMHEYLWAIHDVQMLKWEAYNRLKNVLTNLVTRFPAQMPFVTQIVSTKGVFDENVAKVIFLEDWAIVKRTLDLIGSDDEETPEEDGLGKFRPMNYLWDGEDYD